MMAVFDPKAPPFYEQRRGGGPVTDWMRSREKLFARQQDRKLRLLDPRCVRTSSSRPKMGDGMTYQERRAMGLCGRGCGRESEASMCELCTELRRKVTATYRARQKDCE